MTKTEVQDRLYRAWVAQHLGRGKLDRIHAAMEDAERVLSRAEINAVMDKAARDTAAQRGRRYERSQGRVGGHIEDATIQAAMARVAFVSNWADQQEEKGKTYPGQNLMKVAPRTTSPAAKKWAQKLAIQFVAENHANSLLELYQRAKASGFKHDAEHFGNDIGLEAMGHGVSWTDDGGDDHVLSVPSMEFYD